MQHDEILSDLGKRHTEFLDDKTNSLDRFDKQAVKNSHDNVVRWKFECEFKNTLTPMCTEATSDSVLNGQEENQFNTSARCHVPSRPNLG